MKRGLSRLLAFVLTLAMVFTGSTFFGGTAVVSAEEEKPAITDVEIDTVSGSGENQPAAGGIYAWFLMGESDLDFEDAEVSADDFKMQVKTPDTDWTDTDSATVSFELGDNSDEGVVTANVPDNSDAFVKLWRFVYVGGGKECPAIKQAANEEVQPADLPSIEHITIDEGSDSGENQPAKGGVYAWYVIGDLDSDFSEVTGDAFTMQVKVGDEDWADSDAAVTFEVGTNDDEGVVTATIPDNTEEVAKQWRFKYAGDSVECPAITQAAYVTYVVTFDSNGGAALDPATAETVDAKLESLPEATREGYGFLGWFDAAEGGNKVTTDTEFAEDTTIYAHWVDASAYEASDFTYGNWEWSAKDGLYPVADTSDILAPELWVVTGLNETGKAKLKAGNTKLTIPAADPDGKKVQGVGKNAFYYKNVLQPENLPQLTEVVIPEVGRVPLEKQNWTIKSDTRGDFFIGASAFIGNAIEKVDLADGVVYIGGSAFNTNNLTEITFPKSVSYIGGQAFAKNYELASLTFADKTDLELQIDAGTFGMSVIEEVQLPPTTTKLNKNAFMKAKGQPIVEVKIDGAIGAYVDTSSTYHNVTKISHTITFDTGDESAEKETAETFKNKLESLPADPEKEGYTFLGWFDAAQGGNKVTTDTEFTEDATVYAQWKSPLDEAKEAAIKALDETDLSQYSGDELAAVKKAIADAKVAINAAATVDEVNTALDTATTAITAQKTNTQKAKDAAAAEAKAKKVKTVTINKAKVNAKVVAAAVKKAGGSEKYVTKIVLSKKVKKIAKNTFKKYKKVKTLEVKSKKLKKASVKGALKGSKITKIQVKIGKKAVNKKFVKKYKKFFTKKNAGKKVKVK